MTPVVEVTQDQLLTEPVTLNGIDIIKSNIADARVQCRGPVTGCDLTDLRITLEHRQPCPRRYQITDEPKQKTCSIRLFQGISANKIRFRQIHKCFKPGCKRCHPAVHICAIVQNARLDSANAHGLRAGIGHPMIPATGHQMIPQRAVIDVVAAVDFKSQLSSPACTGNQDLLSTQIEHTCVKIPQLTGALSCCGIAQHSRRFRTLNLQHP